jgi:ATP-binding cassette subfamily B protein
MVMEESFLFSDSVKANIAYGRPDATDEQVLAAARAAEADEFIRELPDGYDTVVGEQGLTLSGGQRQRVALARALITDPRLLLLDDATSAVDPRIEAEIHATLHRVMAGRTTLLIAHRKSTLNLADRIAVLTADGRLADIGTDAELTERCELYRILITGPGDVGGSRAPTPAISPRRRRRRMHRSRRVRTRAWPTVMGVAVGEARRIRSISGGTRARRGRSASPRPRRQRGSLTGRRRAAGAGGGGRAATMDGMIGSVPPSPELLAKVEALPPVKDEPGVDIAKARAGDTATSRCASCSSRSRSR